MMKNIRLDYTNITSLITEADIKKQARLYDEARKTLADRSGPGSDYLGWIDLPNTLDSSIINDIKETAGQVREDSDIFLCVGIGGSYLGARATIEALLPNFYNDLQKPKTYFAGNSISPRYLKDLFRVMEGKKVSINVISKSGTTTETALAFREIREWMIRQYGQTEAYQRIIATTDKSRGALRTLADEVGLKSYVIPDDVGGRFSVLTPVGLLPIAVAGIDIVELIEGAKDGLLEYKDEASLFNNPSAMYALIRNLLYQQGKTTEILADFEPQLHYISEWWKQLFGESEGKENRGIFPASCNFTTDLHSMGQWIQQGRRDIFETFLEIDDPEAEILVKKDGRNLDNLDYLAGKTYGYVNHQALLGTREAHRTGGVPNMTLHIPRLSPYFIGKLFYFFEWAVGLSGYMLGVNPFNQPGVEDYKKNMFALLEKPGYAKTGEKIKNELASREIRMVSNRELKPTAK